MIQNSLQRELEEARAKVRRLEEERDGLQADVEALCLQSQGSSMFSHSRVLAERVAAAEKELKESRGKVRALTEELQAISHELSAARAGRQCAEATLATERERALQLESEKEFHQACSARIQAAKDGMAAELEDMRRRLASTGMALSVAEGRADSEERGKHAAEATLAKRQQQLAQTRQELDAKTAEAASLNRQLHGSMEEVKQLEAKNAKLQAKLALSREDLDRTKQQLQQLRESEGMLRVQLQETAATNAQLQGTVSGQRDKLAEVESSLAALRVSSSEREQAAAALEADLKAKLKEAEETVDEQAQELRQQAFELDAQQALVARLQQESHNKEVAHAQASRAASAAVAQLNGGPGVGEAVSVMGEGAAAGDAASTMHAAGGGHAELDGEVAGMPSSVPPKNGEGACRGAGGAAGLQQGLQGLQPHDDAERSEQLAILNRMVKEMKIKLAQATQEKVEALLLVAQTQQQQQQQAAGARQLSSSEAGPAGKTLQDLPLYAASSTAGRGLASYMTSRFAGLIGGATSSWQTLQPSGSTAAPTSMPGSSRAGIGAPALKSPALGLPPGTHGGGGTGGADRNSMLDAGEGAAPDPQQALPQSWGTGLADGGPTSLQLQAKLHSQSSPARHSTDRHQVHSRGQPPQDAGRGSSGGIDTVAALHAQQQAVLVSLEAARAYALQLRTAAKVLFSQAPEALGQKWAVLTELSKLYEKLHRTRARMGLPAPEPLTLDACTSQSLEAAVAPQGQSPQNLALEHQVTAELLGLVDFGLATLEAYNRMEAMSMICPPTAS